MTIPSDGGAHDAPHAPQHHHHERLEREGLPDLREDVVGGGEQRARHRREAGADARGHHAHPAHVDAHELGRLPVLRGRPDGLPHVGLDEEPVEDGGDEGGHREGEQQRHRHRDPAQVEARRRVGGGEDAVVRGEQEHGRVAENEADADGEQDLVLWQRVQHAVDDGPLQERSEEPHHRVDDHHGDERVDPRHGEEEVREVHPHHHQLAVGEVDDPHHPEDDGQADADEGVGSSHEDAGEQRLQEEVHRVTRLPPRLVARRARVSGPGRDAAPATARTGSGGGARRGVTSSPGRARWPCRRRTPSAKR